MSDRDFVVIYRARNAQHAQALKALLEDEGIPAMVTGEALLPDLVGVEIDVCVRRSDADRARRVGDQFDADASAPGEPWKCPVCDADVDAGFDLCWRCQSRRAVSD